MPSFSASALAAARMLSDDWEYITFVSTGASVGVGVEVSDTAETVEDEAAEEDEAAASAAFFRPLLNPLEKTPTIRKNRMKPSRIVPHPTVPLCAFLEDFLLLRSSHRKF